MTTLELYDRAIRNGCEFECDCSGTNYRTWDKLMKGATKANTILVHKLAKQLGIVPEGFNAKNNPYEQKKTKTHLIYIHSGIEHFIRIL
jgi:hypothetical protein